jgi:hypothetical protein
MTTENTSHPLNTFPFLSEEIERTLRLRAWKDEVFREALIADPKGVIQRLFPQCFPNGRLPEQLTINVIEEDPGTCHIILPPLPDELPIPEIPEEEHLELLANMSVDRKLGGRDPSEKRGSQSPEQCNPSFLEQEYRRRQQAAETKENTPVSGDRHDSQESAKLPTDKQWKQALTELSNDKQNLQAIRELYKENPKEAVQKFFKDYLPDHKFPQGVDVKFLQNTPDTHYMIIPKLPDASHDPAVPDVKLGGPGDSGTRCCMTQELCHTPNDDCL